MAKLKCMRHDRRVMTTSQLIHREDGSVCKSQKVRIGTKIFDVSDIDSEYIRYMMSYKSPAEKLLYEIFGKGD